jgi:phosphoribosylaminoimidazolecarboxamide formyltransferase/IMP cyclohydrolase
MPSLDVVPIRRALISVSDKTGLVELGQALAKRNVEILSTGGTSKALKDAGIPVKDVADFTGFPEMMDGRVKTLHPKVHGALLGRRDDDKHLAAMREHHIEPIDLVVVNLYPFEKIAGQADAHWDELIENVDIGGPSMLRSAAKNHDAVAVVCDIADYSELLAAFELRGGTDHAERRRWAIKVFERTARYDAAIAQRLALKLDLEHDPHDVEPCAKAGLGPVFAPVGRRAASLRYGENPHQMAAVYAVPGDAIDLATAPPLQGKELSYNNMLDADAALYSLRCLVDGTNRQGITIIKHNTPCGAARANSVHEAWTAALAGDPVSAFGGIVAASHLVDEDLARSMAELFLEVVLAPGFSDGARAVFAKKTGLRLLEVPNLSTGSLPKRSVRSIAGGLLVQEADRAPKSVRDGTVVTARAPTDAEWAALDVAFRLCAPVKSNAITLVKGEQLIGAGGGQTSRVDSVRIAVQKAREHKHDTSGAALGSDAFFPFPDGLLAAADAGVTAVAQPGGSKKDDDVIATANSRGIAMVMLGERHFRH